MGNIVYNYKLRKGIDYAKNHPSGKMIKAIKKGFEYVERISNYLSKKQ